MKTIIKELKEDILKYKKMNGDRKTIEQFETEILNLNNPELSCYFAINVKGANLSEHFRIIYNSDDYESLYFFCKKFYDVLSINMDEIAKIIAEKGGADINVQIIKDRSHFDIRTYREVKKGISSITPNIMAIINSGDYNLMIDLLLSHYSKQIWDGEISTYKGYNALNIKLSNKEIKQIGKKIMKAEVYYSYLYAAIVQKEGIDASEHINRILESDDLKSIYLAAKNINCYETNKLLNKIIDSKNAEYNFKALNLKHSDKKQHINVIIENGDCKSLFDLLFSRYVDFKDAVRIFNKIYESKDIEYNYKLISKDYRIIHGEMIDIAKHSRVVIDGDNEEYIYDLISKYPDKINLSKARAKIAKSKNPEYNYILAMKYSDNSEHIKAIIDSNNPGYCYKAARNLDSEYKQELEEVVIKSGSAKYNYLYALNIRNCNLQAHLEVIINSKNAEYNALAIQNIPGVDIERHMDAIQESGDMKYIEQLGDVEPVKREAIHNKMMQLTLLTKRKK